MEELKTTTESDLTIFIGNQQKITQGNPAIRLEEAILKVDNEASGSRIGVVTNVPDDMDIGEFFEIINSAIKKITLSRVLKTNSKDGYAILMEFKEEKELDRFIDIYQEVKYNFMEERKISIKKVKEFCIQKNDENGQKTVNRNYEKTIVRGN